ncbi:unnamed protein product [Symbiodinium necroappetens]|uniref:Uncharacterized protein n=1 Tax=Symbiodinium necroappetens TaxID=1628268 RepID=A0A812VVL8_9DINO|nr:unnamed protein product [Symbiodinium necroappetens]
MVESPSKPQHEEPKAEQHAQPYVAYSPMDNTDTDSESEEEIELEAPQTQKLQNFHNFQVHDDHSSSQTDFHPLMATHIPLTASVDEHRTLGSKSLTLQTDLQLQDATSRGTCQNSTGKAGHVRRLKYDFVGL